MIPMTLLMNCLWKSMMLSSSITIVSTSSWHFSVICSTSSRAACLVAWRRVERACTRLLSWCIARVPGLAPPTVFRCGRKSSGTSRSSSNKWLLRFAGLCLSSRSPLLASFVENNSVLSLPDFFEGWSSWSSLSTTYSWGLRRNGGSV